MSLIPFPNVPAAPGVPDLPRSPQFPPIATAALGLVQGALWRVFQIETEWGIFDSAGKPIGDQSAFSGALGVAFESLGIGLTSSQSTNAVDYAKETRVSDFPLERGSFAAYNKVEAAAQPVVTLCFSGSETTRSNWLNAIDAACKSTDLFSVVTPEVRYIDYSLERYRYSRSAGAGATLLKVEITLKEIRTVSAQFAQKNTPKEPGAAASVDSGKVQAKAPEQSTLKAASTRWSDKAARLRALEL